MVQLICGILRRDGAPADPGLLAAMLSAMNPRGKPEARDMRCEGPLALGVLALAPRPGMTPERPRIADFDGKLLAADARIHAAYPAGAGGSGLQGGADAVAEAVRHFGEAAPRHLNGDFAYALYDRSSGHLVLARDHFGVRPLQYVHRRGDYIAFASLPQALLRTGLAERILDEDVMRYFHSAVIAPGHRTPYRQVRSVLPRHVLSCAPGMAPQDRRYWSLPSPPSLPFRSDPAEIAAEVRRLMDQAVRRRIPARGAVAGHLSGGLDSSSIAVLAARAIRGEGRVFHGFSQQEPQGRGGVAYLDEAPYVAAVAEAEPNIEVVPVGSDGFYRIYGEGIDIDTLAPTSPRDPDLAPILKAAELGAGIMFSGWGGDEFVSNAGRGAEVDLALRGEWRLLLEHVRARSRIYGGTVPGILFNNVVLRLLPVGWRGPVLALLKGKLPERTGLGRLRFLPREKRRRVLAEPMIDGPSSQRARRAYGSSWWIQKKLEIFAQQGAPNGVAFTFPLLDLDLVEYALRVPGMFLRRDGGYRTLMRDATEGILPEPVRCRVEKLMPFPLESLRMARDKQRLLDRLEKYRSIGLVGKYVDLDAVRDYVSALPGPEEVARMIDAAVAEGAQLGLADDDHENAIVLAAFLAEHAGALKTAEGG